MKVIKNVILKTNILSVNHNHETTTFKKKGVLIIEYNKGKNSILDLTASADITNSDYIEIIDTKKTKTKYLFQNTIYKDFGVNKDMIRIED